MVKRSLLAVAIVALLVAGYGLAAGATISLTPDGPEPGALTIPWGDTVTFTNADSKSHQIAIPRLALESPQIPSGGTWEYVFNGSHKRSYGYRQTGGGANKLGSIVVEVDGTVSLKASTTAVLWGSTLRLSGTSSFPGTPVNLAERVPGSGTNWAPIGTVQADAEGAFEFELKPQRGAQFRAQVAGDQISSATVRVLLRPVLTIRTRAKKTKVDRKVTLVARVTPASAATLLDLQRLDPRRSRWLIESRKRVGKNGVVTFVWKARKGTTRLRVGARPLGLKPGWDEAASTPVTIKGVE